MSAILYTVLGWLASSFLARVLVGAGLSVVSFTVLNTVVSAAVTQFTASMGGLPGNVYNILGMMGFWTAFGSVFSAAVTRVALSSALTRITFTPS